MSKEENFEFFRKIYENIVIHSRNKYVASLGVCEGKSREDVCSLHFLEAIMTREGGDYFRA